MTPLFLTLLDKQPAIEQRENWRVRILVQMAPWLKSFIIVFTAAISDLW